MFRWEVKSQGRTFRWLSSSAWGWHPFFSQGTAKWGKHSFSVVSLQMNRSPQHVWTRTKMPPDTLRAQRSPALQWSESACLPTLGCGREIASEAVCKVHNLLVVALLSGNFPNQISFLGLKDEINTNGFVWCQQRKYKASNWSADMRMNPRWLVSPVAHYLLFITWKTQMQGLTFPRQQCRSDNSQ